MKSLPEKNFWNNIKTRLSNYTEEPEDDWDDIAAIISPSRYDARKWIEFSQDIASAVALILLLMFTVTTTDTVPARTEIVTTDRNISSDQKTSKEKSILDAHQKEKHKPATDADESIEESDALINRSGTSSNTNRALTYGYKSIKNKDAASSTRSEQNYRNDLYSQGGHSSKTNEANASDTDINTSGSDTAILPTLGLSTEENSDQINSTRTINDRTIATKELSDIVKKDSIESIKKADSIAHKETEKKEEQQNKKRPKKFHPAIYFTVSPSLAYQKIMPVKNDAINITELKSDGIFSSNRLGLAIDGGFQVPLTKTIEVYAGLSYYQQNQTITYKYSAGTVEEIEGNQDEDYIIKPRTQQKDFSYAMRNAGIAAGFFYRLKTHKLMHKIGAGLQYQKGFIKASEGDTYDNRSSNYLNYQLLYRLELAINARTNFYVQPSFTHAIRASESLHEPFTLKPYRAAIGFGMIYRF
jgi:hypothetical protein